MRILKDRLTAEEGPLHKMAYGLNKSIDTATKRWLDSVVDLVHQFFQRLQKQLESSFNDVEMDDSVRQEACPKFAAVADDAFALLNGQVADWIKDCEEWEEPKFAKA